MKGTKQYCEFDPCCTFCLSANHFSSRSTHFRSHSFFSQVFRLGLPAVFLLCVRNSLLLSATCLIDSIHMSLLHVSFCIFDRSLSIMSSFVPVVERFTLLVMPFVLLSVQVLITHFTIGFICILLNRSIYPLSQGKLLIFQIPK
jgi:hypothetical protein